MRATQVGLQEAIVFFEHLVEHGNITEGYIPNGICAEYGKANRPNWPTDDDIKAHFRTWPLFSGNIHYPVPTPRAAGGIDPKTYYGDSLGDMWQGEYGYSRRLLCAHIAFMLRKELV
jgi:hypothetical protein